MGTINYRTSDYITMGIRPADAAEIAADADFREWVKEDYHIEPDKNEEETYRIAVDLAREYDLEDQAGAERMLEDLADLHYYHIAVKPGYYEGFYIDIENNYGIAYDDYTQKAEAQKEVTRIKKMLLDLLDVGICSVWPGWCTTYRDRAGSLEDIAEAVREMREEIRRTPTWTQYEREARGC